MNSPAVNADRECWIANPVGVFKTRRGLVQLVGSGMSDDEYRAQGWHEIEYPLVDGHGDGSVRRAHVADVFASENDALARHFARAANYAMGPGLDPLVKRAPNGGKCQ